jgi:hypothetical protein
MAKQGFRNWLSPDSIERFVEDIATREVYAVFAGTCRHRRSTSIGWLSTRRSRAAESVAGVSNKSKDSRATVAREPFGVMC